MLPTDNEDIVGDVFRYHEETKHHFERYARSPGHMDWQNQPDPFRFYEKTQNIELPLLKNYPRAEYADLFRRNSNQQQGFTIETIAGFLELSLGLSAWKAVGQSRWSLRMNPLKRQSSPH